MDEQAVEHAGIFAGVHFHILYSDDLGSDEGNEVDSTPDNVTMMLIR